MAYVADSRGSNLYGSTEEQIWKLGIEDYDIHNAMWDARYAKAEFFYNYDGKHVNDASPYGFWEKYDFKTRKFKRFS